MIRLNILDQSPVIQGMSSEEAVQQTIELAKLAEELGYHRYWVAEHHNSRSFASASPEILISALASSTKTIRIGSGGVLISHYSPLKIAEQFNMLQCLYPGRIDLGIGRAPGGDGNIIKAMRTSNEDSFAKITELINYLKHSSTNKQNGNVSAVPEGQAMPEIWILGTSPDSAVFAAENGLPYTFGSFINDEYMLQCFQIYYQNFKPSVHLKEPYLNLALFSVTGETHEDALRISKCSEYWLAQTFLKGRNIPFPDKETSLNHSFSFEEKMLIEYRRRSAVIGDAEAVSKKLNELAKKYAIHEITIVTITSDFEERKKSYRLLNEAMALTYCNH
ncbi:MAG: LLM class flavin-dependent oxidoreductase [Ignavibacteria bacterium]|nr:LLM class flavin-dependent oxidoreductase [Ignavibacteria bacterium]MBK6875131.1 LLM class flavin-dependent oxidoreductase [Ignavibacteria bacterium]MBK9228289.1 LLM class flavin-dependent oxidoreductase [Ignavibacteria bacterium]